MSNIFTVLPTLTLLLNCNLSHTSEIMGYINRNFELNDLLPWILTETSGISKAKCMVMCIPSTNCRGIMYQTSTEGCMLVSYDCMEAVDIKTELIGSSATVPLDQEWVFYHAIRDCRVADCPISQGYTFIAEMCYCMKYHYLLYSYSDAFNHCKNEGGELIKIDSATKQVYVGYYLDLANATLTQRVYIQGMKSGGKWLFGDGTELQYYNWAAEQPNSSPSETIIFLETSDGYSWHDGGQGLYSFVCQIIIL